MFSFTFLKVKMRYNGIGKMLGRFKWVNNVKKKVQAALVSWLAFISSSVNARRQNIEAHSLQDLRIGLRSIGSILEEWTSRVYLRLDH